MKILWDLKILWEMGSRRPKFCAILSHSVRYGMYDYPRIITNYLSLTISFEKGKRDSRASWGKKELKEEDGKSEIS